MSISNPDGDFVKRYDPNDMGSTRMLTEEEKEQIKQGVKNRQESAAAEADTEDDVIRRPTKVVKKVKEEVDFDDDEDDVEEQEHSMDRIAAILAILAVAIIGVILVSYDRGDGRHAQRGGH